jgi:hypothetical protein
VHNSPASHSSLSEYTDYILYNPEANENTLLSEYLQARRGQDVSLIVYSMVTQETREVSVSLRPQGTTTREIIGADLKFERFTDSH